MPSAGSSRSQEGDRRREFREDSCFLLLPACFPGLNYAKFEMGTFPGRGHRNGPLTPHSEKCSKGKHKVGISSSLLMKNWHERIHFLANSPDETVTKKKKKKFTMLNCSKYKFKRSRPIPTHSIPIRSTSGLSRVTAKINETLHTVEL